MLNYLLLNKKGKIKLIILFSIIFLILSFYLVSYFVLAIPEVKTTYKFIKIEPEKIYLALETDYSPEIRDFQKIIKIAEEVASSYEYKLDIYDCTDFSKELIKRLIKEGYKAQCTAGYLFYEDSTYVNHTWVSVWIKEIRFEIESTGGYVIDEEDYNHNYKVLWEDFCW